MSNSQVDWELKGTIWPIVREGVCLLESLRLCLAIKQYNDVTFWDFVKGSNVFNNCFFHIVERRHTYTFCLIHFDRLRLNWLELQLNEIWWHISFIKQRTIMRNEWSLTLSDERTSRLIQLARGMFLRRFKIWRNDKDDSYMISNRTYPTKKIAKMEIPSSLDRNFLSNDYVIALAKSSNDIDSILLHEDTPFRTVKYISYEYCCHSLQVVDLVQTGSPFFDWSPQPYVHEQIEWINSMSTYFFIANIILQLTWLEIVAWVELVGRNDAYGSYQVIALDSNSHQASTVAQIPTCEPVSTIDRSAVLRTGSSSTVDKRHKPSHFS